MVPLIVIGFPTSAGCLKPNELPVTYIEPVRSFITQSLLVIGDGPCPASHPRYSPLSLTVRPSYADGFCLIAPIKVIPCKAKLAVMALLPFMEMDIGLVFPLASPLQ